MLLAEKKLARAERILTWAQKRTPVLPRVPRMQIGWFFISGRIFRLPLFGDDGEGGCGATLLQCGGGRDSVGGDGLGDQCEPTHIFALHSNVNTTSPFAPGPYERAGRAATALTDSRGHWM